jgi:hypothetical protein
VDHLPLILRSVNIQTMEIMVLQRNIAPADTNVQLVLLVLLLALVPLASIIQQALRAEPVLLVQQEVIATKLRKLSVKQGFSVM